MDTMQLAVMEFTITVIITGLAVATGLAINAIRNFTKKVKSETKKIENEEQRNLLNAALDDLETLTTKTVTEIEQTTAKALRESVKDGKTDRAELLALSKKAFSEISNSLQPEYRNMIDKNFGSFSKFLTKAIETKVFELKINTK